MIDFTSQSWRGVVDWAKEELQKARVKNDSRLDDVHTAELRGRIACLKDLTRLPELTATLSQMAEPQE